WGSGLVDGCLVASVVLIAGFLAVERRSSAPMLDLTLFRRRAFNGAAIVAFALSGSIFAMLLYLTLYLQNVLGLSPLGSGLRLLALSGAILVTSFVAGRLTTVVPVRLLMSAGLALVGLSLLMMRGLTVTSHWTHLLPAFLVGGVGVGLINPPLASTPIHVRPPRPAPPRSRSSRPVRQAWARGSTARSARSASPPASPRSGRSSRARSARTRAPGCTRRSWPARARARRLSQASGHTSHTRPPRRPRTGS